MANWNPSYNPRSRRAGGIIVPAYVGPLDLVPGAAVAYGVRALSAAMLGQNIFRLRRDSDDAESDFAADVVTGEAPVAAISAWLDGADGYLVTWYDQSGNSKAALPISSSQFQWQATEANGKPTFTNVNEDSGLITDTASAFDNAITSLCVARLGAGYTDASLFGCNAGSGSDWIDFRVVSNQLDMLMTSDGELNIIRATSDGTVETTLDAFCVVEGAMSQSSRDLRLNGSVLALNPPGGSASGDVDLSENLVIADDDASSSSYWFNSVSEEIIWNSNVAAASRSLARQNQATYFGIVIT